MLKLEKSHIAMISPSPVVAQLSIFHLESRYPSHISTFTTKEEFLKNFRNNFDLIICDQATATSLPKVDPKSIIEIDQPFQFSNLSFQISKLLQPKNVEQYVPVRLEFLHMIEKIKVPLFVRISDKKFIKVEHANIEFNSEKYNQNKLKGLGSLYILGSDIDELIQDYVQSALSKLAWVQSEQLKDQVIVNMETMKTFSEKVGWSTKVLELAQMNIRRALALAKKTKSLEAAFRQFQKIEKFGFADRCLLMTLVSTKLSETLFPQNEIELCKQTFACLFHDITLDEEMLSNQSKYIEQLKSTDKNLPKKLQEYSAHPVKASNMCIGWNLCPPGASDLILNHHETPDGNGFPYGKLDSDMNLDSLIFNVAHDFTNRYIAKYGDFTVAQYLEGNTFSQSRFYQPILKTLASK